MKRKRWILLIIAVCFSMMGCNSAADLCSRDGCSEEVYKDGLCPDHYVSENMVETEITPESSIEQEPAVTPESSIEQEPAVTSESSIEQESAVTAESTLTLEPTNTPIPTGAPSKWDACPISVTGGITGSSNAEVISLTVTNNTSSDIDAIKFLFGFEHSDHTGSRYITATYTLETLWGNETKTEKISGGSYNFTEIAVYPICVYFKDGSSWGDSSASYEEIVENSTYFRIRHFAMPSDETDPKDTQCEICGVWFSSRDAVNANFGDGWYVYCPDCYDEASYIDRSWSSNYDFE